MEVKKVMLAITRYNIYFDVGFFNISVSQISMRKVVVEVWQIFKRPFEIQDTKKQQPNF